MNFDNLIAVLAVAAAVPLILTAGPLVRVPGPVLEIVAGIVLGPAVLDLVKPDQPVRLVSTIGLAFLLFLAGLEIDVRHFRGPRARLAGLALGLSALLALIIGVVLHATGVVENPLLVGIILLATSLGLITPILEDAGVADRADASRSDYYQEYWRAPELEASEHVLRFDWDDIAQRTRGIYDELAEPAAREGAGRG